MVDARLVALCNLTSLQQKEGDNVGKGERMEE